MYRQLQAKGASWLRMTASAVLLAALSACATPSFDIARARSELAGYRDEPNWRAIQQFLPADMRLGNDSLPKEQYWDWRGHQVHMDRHENPASPVKVILLHGVGTNGRQMSLIAGAPLARNGFDTVAPDLPGYGMTRVRDGAVVTYDDWVQMVSDLIDAERRRDGRPVVLYGLSAGGMLAYHAAAQNRKVAGIIGMTFLDQRIPEVRDTTARNLFMSRVGGPLGDLTAATPLGGMKLPMTLTSKMSTLVNNEEALKIFLGDSSSAGNWVSVRFLSSYLNYKPSVEPQDFDVCPILLTQPAEDRWTPLHLSELVLGKVKRVPVKRVMLERAGHYPLEQPGLKQMEVAMVQFINELPAIRRAPALKN